MTIRLVAASGLALATAAMAPGWAGAGKHAARFDAPVRITPANGGGYEPGIYADRFGNLYATAHKENWQLALAPDDRSQTQTRSMSWTWWSADGGKTWKDLPSGPGDAYNHEFGDEGDMAFDDADNLYFVDTDVTDVTLTAWHLGQNGPTFDHNNPLPGMGEAVDDRPWVTAHGDGHVFYFGNQGDKVTYPAGNQDAGPGTGPGRYTVYKSTDGGKTFDHVGITLKDSGWCRPAAAPNSSYVYALCGNDGGADDTTTSPGDKGYEVGTVWSFVSPDDGKTWFRYPVTHYNAHDEWFDWPTLQVASDGSLWGWYLDGVTPKCKSGECVPTSAHFLVMHSTDHGKHWTTYDATPTGAAANWQYRYGWLSVAGDNHTLALGIFGRPYDAKKDPDSQPEPWRVYGAVFKAGSRPTLVSLDQAHPVTPPGFSEPPGDFLMSTFDSRGTAHIAWTRVVSSADAPQPVGHVTTVYRDIYTASQS